MNETKNTITQHLHPGADKFNIVGIALIAQDHDPKEVIGFYHRAGTLPDLHPVVLYEVKGRGTDGDKLSRALISLGEGRVLTVGTHLFYVTYGRTPLEPTPADVELVRSTLESIGVLSYEAKAVAGDGREVRRPVHITQQIEDLLDYHLATPVKES